MTAQRPAKLRYLYDWHMSKISIVNNVNNKNMASVSSHLTGSINVPSEIYFKKCLVIFF